MGNLDETKQFLGEAMPMFSHPAAHGVGHHHHLHGDADPPDGAETRTQCHNPMTMGDAEHPDLMVCGLWYVDKLVRTADGWRIQERVEDKVYMKVFPGK